MTLEEFCTRGCSNAYISFGPLSVYVRHMVEGKLLKTFDIANVSNEQGTHGHGAFWQLLEHAAKVY